MFDLDVGSALAAVGSFFGQRSANNANRNIARETNSQNWSIAQASNAFNANQAQAQMNFQENMSNTSWRRGVADMRAAGINPMLAVSQGGASSPSGSAASAQQIAMQTGAAQQDAIGPAVSSAMNALRLKADLANAAATNANIKSQTQLNRASTTKVSADAALSASNLNKAATYSNLWGIANRVSSAGVKRVINPTTAHAAKRVGDFYSKYRSDSPTGNRVHKLYDSNPYTKGMFGL